MTAPSVEMFEELDVLQSCCRSSFRRFIREAWHLVPGAGAPVWNWHMWAIADEMQRRAEDVFAGRPRRHDVVINISPGTSKSTICSILFHPWTWTRMPTARHLNASHTSDLVLDLAYKSREVIRSEWYRQLFPEVVLCDDADAKGLFRNTAGGDRLACTVAGRSPMGFHAHFLTCLPYESRVITDIGELPIGRVVEEGLDVRVLGWDHEADRPAWNVIESWQKNQPKSLVRVSFSDGTSIESTEEHPVYVKDREYVPAIDLKPGDEVIHASRKEVPGVRDRSDRRPTAERWNLLRKSLQREARGQGAVQAAAGSQHVPMPGLREDGVPKAGSLRPDEIVRRRLLLDGLPGDAHEWRRASEVFQSDQVVFGLREGDSCISRQGAVASVLQQRMLWEGGKWEESPELSGARQGGVRLVRPDDPRAPEGVGPRSILREGVRGRSSFSSDAWRGQLQLSARVRGEAVPQEVLSDASHDPTERGRSVLVVREESQGERGGPSVGRASLGFRRDEQSEGQPGRPLSVVPCQDAWPSPASLEVRSKVVVAVERAVRIPRAVYNLGLDQNHNFFAEGTLVHNCDDPIDPKKVLSAAELKTAREFMTSVLPTRKVDKKVSVTFLIMQRLHAEDPTAVMLETSRKEGATPVKHYCLPAELPRLDDGAWDGSAVKPRKLASRYTEGVMDPGRLDRQVLNTFRAQLGAYGFAGQFLQSPTPPGGGMFKAIYFNQRVKAAPYHAKRIRYWDRACLVAGTMVETIDGPKLIESIVAGELVLTRNGYRRVSRAGMTKYTDDLVRATFSNGAEIVGTPDHLTWSSSGWIPLSSVASDRYDFIALGEEGSCSGRGCESSEGRNPIPNALSLMGYSTPDAQGSAITKRFAGTWRLVSTFPIPCTEPFGGFTTGTYRQGTTFTTAMGIGTTTTPAIWNACLERITTESTIRLRRGTARQKPLLCESGTCARHGRTCRTANGRACIAEDRLRRGILIPSDRCIAQRSVDGGIKIPSWIARAFGADNRSRVVRKPITACSVGRIWVEKPVPVYDLTVEGDPEFFANGILVHNSTDGGGCRTAGVLLALADDGNFYVEHVVAGQWEPTQRNEQMRATAIRDKLRYGPKNAPVIWVEAEGGSSGRDAWKGVAAALVGFPVREDRVTGSKVTRAEPWSAQLAARNVFIVDNGGSPDWDVQGYVDEHVSFPLGKLKDVVDASSGAFNLLVGRKATPQLRVLSVGGRKGLTKIVSCSKEELGVVIVDEPALLIVVEDPPPPGELASPDGSLPPHSCLKLVDGLRLTFADVVPSEVQSAWNEPLEPYGRKPEELIMRPEDGKRLWAAISKKRSGPAPVLLFVDDGGDDRRALSVAMGVSDVIGQPRSAIHRPSRPDEAVSGDPPNAHVHSIVKSSRSSVV